MTETVPEDVTIPPPAIKEIIVKTATYVHKNGKDFEAKILSSSTNNQFSFINPSDDYHAFYSYVLDNIELFNRGGDGQGDNGDALDKLEIPKPHDLVFLVENLPPITLKDLEVIKLTAMFVAKNGESYINSIKSKYREQLTSQFSFLDLSHSFHQVFLKYLKQYKILLNREENSIDLDYDVIESCFQRAEYDSLTKKKQEKLEKIEDLKRKKYQSINWKDFIIVETIEFTEIDDVTEFPEPFTKEDLQFRSLEAKSKQVTEYKSDKSTGSTLNIKEFGTTRLKKVGNNGGVNTSTRLIECPITGQMIPEANFDKHIQILLRDPKYKVEKERYESKIKNSNLTSNEVITNIKNLFKKPNPDSNKRQKVQWDGYRSSVEFVKDKNASSEQEELEYKRKQDEKRNNYGPQLPTH